MADPSCRTQARASIRVSLAAAPGYGFYSRFASALLLFALNFLAGCHGSPSGAHRELRRATGGNGLRVLSPKHVLRTRPDAVVPFVVVEDIKAVIPDAGETR